MRLARRKQKPALFEQHRAKLVRFFDYTDGALLVSAVAAESIDWQGFLIEPPRDWSDALDRVAIAAARHAAAARKSQGREATQQFNDFVSSCLAKDASERPFFRFTRPKEARQHLSSMAGACPSPKPQSCRRRTGRSSGVSSTSSAKPAWRSNVYATTHSTARSGHRPHRMK